MNEQKYQPISFTDQMVRAILDGRKTQTRRIIKFNPAGRVSKSGRQWHIDDDNAVLACPYGQPGDRLWMKENFDFMRAVGADHPQACLIIYWATGTHKVCVAPPYNKPLLNRRQMIRSSILMPRWASRITLEITGMRVERLQDISEDDCLAEGIGQVIRESLPSMQQCGEYDSIDVDLVAAYGNLLWDSINGPGSWDKNPWVWVIEFKRVDA